MVTVVAVTAAAATVTCGPHATPGDGTGILGLYVDQRNAGVTIVLLVSASSLRLLKMTRYLLGTRVLMDTLRRSFTALAVPVYLLFMLVAFFGTLVFAGGCRCNRCNRRDRCGRCDQLVCLM